MADKPTKIREFSAPQGRAGRRMVRVRDLDPDETIPAGAEPVDDNTEAHDWKVEEK